MSFFWWSVTLALFSLFFMFLAVNVRSDAAAVVWAVIMSMLRFAAICCFAIWIIRVAIGTA